MSEVMTPRERFLAAMCNQVPDRIWGRWLLLQLHQTGRQFQQHKTHCLVALAVDGHGLFAGQRKTEFNRGWGRHFHAYLLCERSPVTSAFFSLHPQLFSAIFSFD